MNNYTLESFITFCDNMMISNESFSFKSIKDTIVNIFNGLVDLIESKVKTMNDSKLKSILLRLLSRAKSGLSKCKSLNENDKNKVDELKTEAEDIKEELNDVLEESNSDNNATPYQRKKIKIANPVNTKIYSAVEKCCEKNDVKGLKYIFADSLDADPTFLTYRKSYEYTKKYCDGFPEQHKELTKFETDKSKWDEEYWAKLKIDYVKNGSDERLRHMIEVAKVVLSVKIERLRKERLQRALHKK